MPFLTLVLEYFGSVFSLVPPPPRPGPARPLSRPHASRFLGSGLPVAVTHQHPLCTDDNPCHGIAGIATTLSRDCHEPLMEICAGLRHVWD